MLVWFLGFTTVVLLGLVGVYLYLDHRKQKRQKSAEQEIKNQLYELNLLKQITDRIGYSLSFEAIAESIILTVQDLFDASTMSYAIKHSNQTVTIKTFVKEGVGQSFLQLIDKIIFSGAVSIDPSIANFKVVETQPKYLSQVNIYTYFDAVPQSYFNIPLIFENQLFGMINIASRKKGMYQDAQMSLLYKIVNAAQIAVGRLHDVIETEKSKLDSLILSLPSGTIMFSFEPVSHEQGAPLALNLSVINQAAKNFLKIGRQEVESASVDGVDNREQIGMNEVLSKFGPEIGLIDKIKEVISKKITLRIQEVNINGVPLSIFINPVFRHKDQNIIGVAVIMQDLSLEKKLEKMRENFTNMIVHELRAPTAAIKGAASLLSEDKLNPADHEKVLHVISQSAETMLGTINELLDIGQMEEGKLKIQKQTGDIEKVILNHIEVFSYAAREKNIKIGLVRRSQVPEFLFDENRIGQVINNIVSNSLKFGRSGGKIDIEIQRLDNNVEVCVSDNGIGIPAAKKSILFTKFGQIDPTSQSSAGQAPYFSGKAADQPGGGSSGLGLYVSKQIIEAHGGKIWIESEEGKGTKVCFTLPIVTENKSANVALERLPN